MIADILERLRTDVVIMYIPMQTFLVHDYGKPMEAHLSDWVVTHPEEFQDAIRRSFDAGCEMVHTATQASSPFRARPFGKAVEDRVYELNYRSAKLAREVTPEDRYVVGNISSTNPDFLEPLGNMTYDEVYKGYKLQISALAEGGVDMFHIAGNHIDEALIAIKVARDLTKIPVMALNDYYAGKKGFRDWTGFNPMTASAMLQDTGAEVIGAICGLMTKSLDTSDWYPAATALVKEMRQGTHRPLCIQPDPGIPQIINGEAVWPVSPDEMANETINWIDAGACCVGGCCGTSLEHYRKLSAVIREWRARNR